MKRELVSSGYSCRVDGVLRCQTVIGVCALLGDSCVAVVVVPFDAVSRDWCVSSAGWSILSGERSCVDDVPCDICSVVECCQ